MSLIDGIHLLEVFAWPLLVGIVIFGFRRSLFELLNRVGSVTVGPVTIKIQKELDEVAKESAKKALSALSSGPSDDERNRAARIAKLVEKTDIAVVRHQVDSLAIEYDFLRGSMPSGKERIRKMEVVVSKMRAIGQAAHAIRYELAASPSPGRRLQAVACLQVLPDYEMLDWLGERVWEEKPFVSYHALVALNAAARRPDTREHLKEIGTAYECAAKVRSRLADGEERLKELTNLRERIATLLQET